ncbi:MAG TPA: SDR family oxidoreductase [Chitinophagaceae bacterium]|nr:SDR family oxidoreductase [Chitinophagaceae bacterium]
MNIIITGASRGIGKATAEIFAANGHHLYLCSHREAALYKTMEELLVKYPAITIKAKPFDLSKRENAIEFGNWVLSYGISPDVLFNNAGSFEAGRVHNEPDMALKNQIETNLYSAYHLTRTLLPKMVQQKKGHIFNMCSVASIKAYNNGGSYSISKFALHGFSKNLREEMKPHGVKVTSVIAGAAYTDSWAASGIDKKRFMEAEDIGKMIYAASQLSSQACVEEILMRPQLGDI